MALKLSNKEINILRNRVYQGYKGYDPVTKERGPTGLDYTYTPEGINYDWYKGYGNTSAIERHFGWGDIPEESTLWSKVAEELGIRKIDSQNDLRQMYDYVLGYKPPAPAAPAPAPAVAKPPATPSTPTNTYQTQISQLQSTLGTTQTALDKAIADAQESTKSYQSLINNLKLGFGNQLATAQANYNTQTQDLIKNYGLQISGLKTDFANQFAQQAAEFKTKFEGQEASFVERLAKQQKGFDVSMANQSIAGRAPNLQIGSSQSSSPQQGGTAGFRRRPLQFNTPAYAGLSINSGNINI